MRGTARPEGKALFPQVRAALGRRSHDAADHGDGGDGRGDALTQSRSGTHALYGFPMTKATNRTRWAGPGRQFNKAAEQADRTELEAKGLAPCSINVRLSAIRRLNACAIAGTMPPANARGVERKLYFTDIEIFKLTFDWAGMELPLTGAVRLPFPVSFA